MSTAAASPVSRVGSEAGGPCSARTGSAVAEARAAPPASWAIAAARRWSVELAPLAGCWWMRTCRPGTS